MWRSDGRVEGVSAERGYYKASSEYPEDHLKMGN